MALVFLMLSSAVTSAARVNATLDNRETAFTTEEAVTTDCALTVTVSGQSPVSVQAKHYQTNGYCYYEYRD